MNSSSVNGQVPTNQCYNNNSNLVESASNSSKGLNEPNIAFENIFSTNLEDLIESDDDYTICEEMEEMIADAMNLPQDQRERRLTEIHQHIRFLKGQEKHKKILTQKNHRPFDDSNIGLCSVCLDDNFQIVHPCGTGTDMACSDCFRKLMM